MKVKKRKTGKHLFGNLRLGTKLVAAFLLVGVIPFAVVSAMSLWQASRALSSQAFDQLESVREIKKAQVEQFFAGLGEDMQVLKDTVASLRQAAFAKLEMVQEVKKAQVEKYLRRCLTDISVLSKSSSTGASLGRFQAAIENDEMKTESALWQYAASQYDDSYKQFKREYGYEDVLLISTKGDVVYSTNKGPELTENVAGEKLKGSPLAKCFAKSLKEISLQDFEPYAVAMNRQSAFVGAPVEEGRKGVVGVVIVRLSVDPINAITQTNAGMGKGQSYLVGAGQNGPVFRSDLINMGDKSAQYKIGASISTPYVDKALAGETGSGVFLDSLGNPCLVSYKPLNVPGLTWGCISKVDMEEAIAPKLVGEEEDYYAKYVKGFGYRDLLLINPDGKVFYTVAHAADYGTNMSDGKYASSQLGSLFKEVIRTKLFGVSDCQLYEPSSNEPATFIAQPIVVNDKVEVVVALNLPLDQMNKFMHQRQGMGKTGETYLIGPDKLMRSDSMLDPKTHSVKASFTNPEKGKVDTPATRQALAGKTGEAIIRDYSGEEALTSYTPVSVGGRTWALVAQIDQTEAFLAVQHIKWLIGLIAVIGIGAIIIVAWFSTRAITKPINRVIQGLARGAERVTSASEQVSASSQQSAEGASEQAASIEETSSSMEEMSSMTKQNADNANHADSLMKETKSVVNQANGSMSALTSSMTEISNASKQTSKIIKTIDEIAFQTNLLALNAAVEAARAGEAGAGFAVVADEVRSLAMRAADAARNTAGLIEETVKKVDEGAKLVKQSNDAFSGVAESSSKVSEIVAEIAAASNEQSQGIQQVNKAITEMDRVTQQNAANAEESASASEELNSQARELRGLVGELVTLVGNDKNGKKDRRSKETASPGLPAGANASKKQLATLPREGSAGKKAAPEGRGGQNKKALSPEDVIPLEKEDFEDF